MSTAIMKAATIALVLISARLGAQASTQPPTPDTSRVRRGSEFLIPASSLLLPGLGQYLQRAPRTGAAYTATFILGVAVGSRTDVTDLEDLPRTGDEQLSQQGWHVASTSALLSSWDAFHRAVPALQRRGKYQFLPPRREKVGQLIGAPFDVRFLKRWTTWVALGQTAVITAIVISERERDGRRLPFRAHDAAYATSLSMNASVGEEAFFRGYLLPLFYQHTEGDFWRANAVQGALFGAAHLPGASWFALEIAAWAMWEGWVVRRNGWSIRESIFHHFWYDVAVISAEMATQKTQRVYRITLPPIPF